MRRVVLFDFYDTLARSERGLVRAGRRRVAELCGVDADRLDALWNETLAQRTLGAMGCLEEEIANLLCSLGVTCDREQAKAFAATDRAAWIEAVQLYPDAVGTLEGLRARGFGLGLVSNCSCQAGDVLRASGLDHHFDRLALSYELGVAKPDPAIFLAACTGLGIRPEAAVFVADGSGGELDAARSLGMLAVLIEHGDRRVPSTDSYDLRIRRLTDLLHLPELQPARGAGPR